MQEIMDLIRSTLRGIWTYRWWGFYSMVLVGVGGIAMVDTIPNQYEATTRVYVDTQSILRPLMSGTRRRSRPSGRTASPPLGYRRAGVLRR